ncbi:MAG TPA: fluoride efflux transporter CrcB [Thermomicrobiales bacterium]
MGRSDEYFVPDEAIAEAELATVPGESRPSASDWWRRLAPYLMVGAGGAMGANLRYLVGLWATARWPGPFPWGTLLINLTGSLLLGGLLTTLAARRPEPRLWRLFLGTGLLGAYTTFSTFSAETVALAATGYLPLAIAYVLLSVGGGYGAAWAGMALVRWWTRAMTASAG